MTLVKQIFFVTWLLTVNLSYWRNDVYCNKCDVQILVNFHTPNNKSTTPLIDLMYTLYERTRSDKVYPPIIINDGCFSIIRLA